MYVYTPLHSGNALACAKLRTLMNKLTSYICKLIQREIPERKLTENSLLSPVSSIRRTGWNSKYKNFVLDTNDALIFPGHVELIVRPLTPTLEMSKVVKNQRSNNCDEKYQLKRIRNNLLITVVAIIVIELINQYMFSHLV